MGKEFGRVDVVRWACACWAVVVVALALGPHTIHTLPRQPTYRSPLGTNPLALSRFYSDSHWRGMVCSVHQFPTCVRQRFQSGSSVLTCEERAPPDLQMRSSFVIAGKSAPSDSGNALTTLGSRHDGLSAWPRRPNERTSRRRKASTHSGVCLILWTSWPLSRPRKGEQDVYRTASLPFDATPSTGALLAKPVGKPERPPTREPHLRS